MPGLQKNHPFKQEVISQSASWLSKGLIALPSLDTVRDQGWDPCQQSGGGQ